ncbi:MAG: efflux RND transporter periplasmic adaptor subunit [Bacteroidetes bacterium]|nr:efflux RND transporter periplasmic adaptor subunit [Bacteroidota bacterium]MBU1680392.1 efflux RND transporter periplasmic adaptor subunit [Bacteroidota bacterium]
MNFNSTKYFAFTIALLASMIIANGCGDSKGSETETVKDQKRAASVEIVNLKGREYTDFISVVGTIKPAHRSNLSALETGNISAILKDKGSYVKKGDTIAVIENNLLKASMDAAKAQYELAEITFDKQSRIFKENINSEFQFLQSKYQRNQAKANYEMAKARYDYTFITAPFNGVVDNRFFEKGELAGLGFPIIDLVDISSYKIEAGVPERYVGKIQVGNEAKVYLKNVKADPVKGRVSFVSNSVTIDNRTFIVEITLLSVNSKIKPELVAEVKIVDNKYAHALIIPDEVVTRVDDGYQVFIEKNGIAEGRKIQILNRSNNEIAVESGLSEGENLIVVGYQNLVHGQAVKVVN